MRWRGSSGSSEPFKVRRAIALEPHLAAWCVTHVFAVTVRGSAGSEVPVPKALILCEDSR